MDRQSCVCVRGTLQWSFSYGLAMKKEEEGKDPFHLSLSFWNAPNDCWDSRSSTHAIVQNKTKTEKAFDCINSWWKWSNGSEGGKSCFFFHFQQIVWISIHLHLRAYLQADLLALFRPSSGDFISLKVFSWISVLVSQKPWHIECTVGTLKEKGKADKTHCKTTKTNTNSLQSYDQK